MKRRSFFCSLAVGLLCFVLFSCTPVLEIDAKSDGGYNVSYSVKFGNFFLDTIYSMTGMERGSYIFDAREFQSQFSAAGIKNVSVVLPSSDAIQLSAPLSPGGADVFAAMNLISRKNSAGRNTMTLELSRKTLGEIYDAFPDMARSYIDLFMAPVFTGDAMTKGEYIELVAMVYGQQLADEIALAKLSLTLSPPNKKGKKQFAIPLVDLLVADSPFVFSVEW